MNNQIKCPYCKKSFEPTDAFKHELEEKIFKETQIEHQKVFPPLRCKKD